VQGRYCRWSPTLVLYYCFMLFILLIVGMLFDLVSSSCCVGGPPGFGPSCLLALACLSRYFGTVVCNLVCLLVLLCCSASTALLLSYWRKVQSIRPIGLLLAAALQIKLFPMAACNREA